MTANHQVDASTVKASALFGNNRFSVPDFQRDYSWRVDNEIADFWQDVSDAIESPDDYFLGLVILTDDTERREIVDGQQRLITISLFANALRLAAVARNRNLVADTLRNTFLFSIDYATEEQVPRLHLTDADDSEDFQAVLNAATQDLVPSSGKSQIIAAYLDLASKLAEDLHTSGKPELRIGQWAEFITNRLTFTVFAHPDRAAAFRVYEVVNTRGKDLTPAELIKSFLIGSSGDGQRAETFRRWRAIEQQLEDLSAGAQVTTFVRHVVALTRGYVIPRELYQVVTKNYQGAAGTQRLLQELESHLATYLQMLDPSADTESSEVRTSVFDVLEWLSGSRFRPIFLAAAATGDDSLLRSSLDIIVPGIIAGRFGTGSIEAQFARAARRLHSQEASWQEELESLRQLMPPREEFQLRLTRNLNRYHALVLRSAIIQDSTVPGVVGYAHQIRPRHAEAWPDFDADDYREIGTSLANWVLVTTERRPQGSRTPQAVADKLLTQVVDGEFVRPDEITGWTSEYVRQRNSELAARCGELWYGRR